MGRLDTVHSIIASHDFLNFQVLQWVDLMPTTQDLPCNCGLSECEPREGAERAQGCCAFAGGQPRCDRRIRMESVPEINTPEDTESLTSTALAELEAFGDPISFWKTCRLNRQLRASDKTIEELLWNCHRLATRFLLLKQNLDVLGRWCRFAHRLRRAATDTADLAFPRNWPSPTLLRPFNAETGKVEVLRTEDLRLTSVNKYIDFS